MRKEGFENYKYYHIFNRGVDKRDIYLDTHDYVRFIKSMREFNVLEPIGSIYEREYKSRQEAGEKKLSSLLGTKFPDKQLVDFISYCLNPNHYHFITKQLEDNGISKFMHRLSLGYTNFFNNKYKHSGSLFQGTFKAIEIKSLSHLLHLSVYANCNAQIHEIIHDASKYPWCSYPDYLGKRCGTLCSKDDILSEFDNIESYIEFTNGTMVDIINSKKERAEWLEK